MAAKYEAHITLPIASALLVQAVAKKEGWKYSAIDGDALMESKPYCYLTAYDTDGGALLKRMGSACVQLKAVGVDALRLKVERIVYDTKTGVNELQLGTA